MTTSNSDSTLKAANQLLSYILSVRLENTPEWMDDLCEQINRYAEATGDSDRVEPYRDALRILRKSVNHESNCLTATES